MSRRNSQAALLLLFAVGAGGCDFESSNGVVDTVEPFEEFRDQSYEPSIGAYIVEGDIEVSLQELRAYYDELHVPSAPGVRGGLKSQKDPLITTNHVNALWNTAQKRNLYYCVSADFDMNHDAVIQAMSEAARDWESCADVKFTYLSSRDRDCEPRAGDDARQDEVLFYVQSNPKYIRNAKAFFPDDDWPKRTLQINWKNVTNDGSKTLPGILRHELGHILGFVHEHAHPSSKCIYQDKHDALRILSDTVDNSSVMYYTTCHDSDHEDYVLSPMDRDGAAKLYGPSKG